MPQPSTTPWVKLTVLADNRGNPHDESLKSTWGLSILVETRKATILFDADTEPSILENNTRRLDAGLEDVDCVVLSHEHRDHVGGLEYFAKVNRHAPVYAPMHASRDLYKRLGELGFTSIGVEESMEISEGVSIVGELEGPPYEEALAVNVEGLGLIVLVGCSHPGVDMIVEKAIRDLGVKPHAVIGGFHLWKSKRWEVERTVSRLLSLGVETIYPMHCSGDTVRSVVRALRPSALGEAYTGSIIEFYGRR